jgi:CubicO group peptidase (beta-lactamase class C family)
VPAFERQDAQFARAFDILRDAIREQAFPGASVAITHRARLVALKGVGRFAYGGHSPEVTPDTIYDLASVTKVVATTPMAMLLYDRGLLDLDAPVFSIVPEFASNDPRRGRVTVRMLLAHSAGLPAYVKLFETARTRDELLLAAFTTRFATEPGTVADYSDLGFIVLGVLLERIAADSLSTFCEFEVFGPLGMTRTGFCPPRALRRFIPPTEDDTQFRARSIQGEVNDENAWVMGGVAGHAGVFASAEDVARFAECMLAGGRPIIRPETVALFTRRQDSPAGSSRALGWDTPSAPSQSGKHFSSSSFGHLGFTGTSLWIDPERKLSVTLLTNRTWPDRAPQLIKQVRPRFHDAVLEALEK